MTAFFTENDNLDKIENDCITSYSTECKTALAFCTAGIFLLSIIFLHVIILQDLHRLIHRYISKQLRNNRYSCELHSEILTCFNYRVYF